MELGVLHNVMSFIFSWLFFIGLVDIVIGEEEPERLNFTNSSYQANINENSEKGVLITKVEARLVNESHQIQYKLFSPSVNNSLEIDPDSGWHEFRNNYSAIQNFETRTHKLIHAKFVASSLSRNSKTAHLKFVKQSLMTRWKSSEKLFFLNFCPARNSCNRKLVF